jgi:hypothetical protein
MDHIEIKEEVEETDDAGSLSSGSESYRRKSINASNSSPSYSIPSSSSSFPPTQRVLPSSLSSRRGLADGVCGRFPHFSQNANEALFMSSSPPSLKQRGPEIVDNRSKQYRNQQSLMSPPLLPTGSSFQPQNPNSRVAVIPGYPQNTQDGGVSQEDEWKSIKVVRRIVDYT